MNQERIYTVLREPHFSEKASILGDEANQYAFKVDVTATKAEIKTAVFLVRQHLLAKRGTHFGILFEAVQVVAG